MRKNTNQNNKRSFDRISSYFLENLHIVIPLVITALCFDSLMCFLPVLEGRAVNSLASMDFESVKRTCLVFGGLVLFVQANRFAKRYLVRIFGNKIALQMRSVSFGSLLDKDISDFSSLVSGDILNKNVSDIYDTAEGVRKMTTEVFDTFVLLLGYMVMLFVLDSVTTLACLPFLVISVVLSQSMKKAVYRTNREYKEFASEYKEITVSSINNELYYRGFGVSDNYFQRFDEATETLRKKNLRALVYRGSFEWLYICLATAGLGVAAYLCGKKVVDGVYDIGVMTSFLTTFTLVARKTGKVGKLFNAYQAFCVSWQRCKSLAAPQKEKESHDISDNAVTLSVRNISFSYDNFTLPSITFDGKIGDIIAVCGKVHTGKTTLLKALSGLYDYEGHAVLGGEEIRRLSDSKKQYVAYCASKVELFSDTVESNVRLGREGNFEKALLSSALFDDLEEIGGKDNILSHTNANLSGGQQKRLQTARALYPDVKLILLDDPFQSVDACLSEKMMNGLRNYSEQIIVIVSNNRDILGKADKIVFIDGEKAEVGSYESLSENAHFSDLTEV